MDSDTRQLNHLVVHSVIDSLVVEAPRELRVGRDRVGLFSLFILSTIHRRFIRRRCKVAFCRNQREIARISRLPAIRGGGQVHAAKVNNFERSKGIRYYARSRKTIRMLIIERRTRNSCPTALSSIVVPNRELVIIM